MNTVRKSLAYTFAEGYLTTALQLVGMFFLARLLTPGETGVWAIAAVFPAVASMVRDFGVGEYLIQEKDLTRDKLRAALTVNIIVSWLMAVLLLGSSAWVGAFYGERGVTSVMRVQALNFFFVPFGAVTFAYFRRSLDYRPFFWSSTLSNLASIGLAVSLAWAGFGYMSLAYSSLAGVLVSVAVATVARPKGFPRLPGFKGLRAVVRSGSHLTGVYLFGQVGKSAPELVIGKVLGVEPVGFFSRANGLNELFNRLVLRATLPVCLPYFAKEEREGRDIREGYLRALSYLTVIGWPCFSFLAAMSYPCIRILYGSQWMASVPLARILCVVAAVGIMYLLATEVLIARGDAAFANYLQAINQAARIIGVLAVIPFGLEGACWGLLAAAIAGGAWSQRALKARIGLTIPQVIQTCTPSMAITLISTGPAIVWASLGRIDESNFIYVMAAAIGSFGMLWLVAIRAMRHPLWSEFCSAAARWRNREQRA